MLWAFKVIENADVFVPPVVLKLRDQDYLIYYEILCGFRD